MQEKNPESSAIPEYMIYHIIHTIFTLLAI